MENTPHDCVPIPNRFKKSHVCIFCGRIYAPVDKIRRETYEEITKLCLRDEYPLESSEAIVIYCEEKIKQLKE